jgi:hypothetical protein
MCKGNQKHPKTMQQKKGGHEGHLNIFYFFPDVSLVGMEISFFKFSNGSS